ncbi:hypothetical protein FKP32DRAFT_657295 [Trametes sanguinea]|nr:hypothetical protein FKP32DRAFT_657295 [Trametes sanguinea]
MISECSTKTVRASEVRALGTRGTPCTMGRAGWEARCPGETQTDSRASAAARSWCQTCPSISCTRLEPPWTPRTARTTAPRAGRDHPTVRQTATDTGTACAVAVSLWARGARCGLARTARKHASDAERRWHGAGVPCARENLVEGVGSQRQQMRDRRTSNPHEYKYLGSNRTS